MKRITALIALTLSAALLLPAAPAAAVAEPPVVERVVTWFSTDSQPEFLQTVMVDGAEYQLSASSVEVIDTQYGQVPAQRSQTVSCWPADLETVRGSFAPSVQVDEDGYQGSLPLTGVTYEPINAFKAWEVNETRTYQGLTSNDVDQIPAVLETTGAETGNALTLRLASLSWAVDAVDAHGLPSRYTATAIYRGADEGEILDHYQVTAFYEGTLDATAPVITYQATLSYVSPDPNAVGAGSFDAQQDSLAGVLAAVGAAVTAAAAGGFFFWYRGRDVRVCRKEGETLKVVAKASSKRASDGALLIDLPATLSLLPGQTVLLLAPHKADGGPVRVTQCGSLVFDGRANKMMCL